MVANRSLGVSAPTRVGLIGFGFMLDYCAKHGISSDIELIDIAYINEAYERMLKSDVRYRFVIDMASLT